MRTPLTCFCILYSVFAIPPSSPAAEVRVRIIDQASGEPTPAMACITGPTQAEVRLPPDGRSPASLPAPLDFARGFAHRPEPGWIGPVRKTMGKGNNDDRSYVYELRPSIPHWREPVMYQVNGEFTIELPAGKWRLAVQRGMEYIPMVQEFTVQGSSVQQRTVELVRWANLAKHGWYSGDVHVHHVMTNDEQREFLLSWALASDLNVVNVLEMGWHDGTLFSQAGFGAKGRFQKGRYAVAAGQECPRSTFGHIIGLNIRELVRDPKQYDFYDVPFRKIHQQPGALVGFAHLAWNGCDLPRGFPFYVTTGEIDFVELLQFSVINAMDYYDYLNLGLPLTAAAGSDVPWGSTIGEVRTYVYTGQDELNLDAWFAGLKAGRTFVSNGPSLEFTVNGQLPGSRIECTPGQRLEVAAKVCGHPAVGLPKALSIVSNEGVLKEAVAAEGAAELKLDLEVDVPQSRWLVASATCTNNAVAHSSPVYAMVNGRPHWCAKRGPAVIDQQLAAMDKIAGEFAGNDPRSRGVRERMDKARRYYADLRAKMAAEGIQP